jgi:hypothetical protein
MTLTRTLIALSTLLLTTVNQAQWQAYNTGLGSINSMTTQAGDLYVVSFPSGIFVSENDGVTWTPRNSGLPASGGDISAQSIGSNDTWLFAGTTSGIYRSNDQGVTWTAANGALPASQTIYANKFFRSGSTMLAIFSGAISQGGGIYRTVNNGTSWLQGASGLSSNMTVYQVANINNQLYAATSAGIYRSTDNAQNWTAVTGSAFATYAVQGSPSRMVCLSDFGWRWSNDNGTSWNDVSGEPAPSSTSQLILYDGKYFAISGPTGAGVFQSLNGGQTWSAYNSGLGAVDLFLLDEFHASGTNLYLSTGLDLYSIEGTTLDVGTAQREDQVDIYPTVFSDGFTVDLSSDDTGSLLLMIDAMGREVLRQNVVSMGKLRIERGTLTTGAYRVMLLPANWGHARDLGTVIAD